MEDNLDEMQQHSHESDNEQGDTSPIDRGSDSTHSSVMTRDAVRLRAVMGRAAEDTPSAAARRTTLAFPEEASAVDSSRTEDCVPPAEETQQTRLDLSRVVWRQPIPDAVDERRDTATRLHRPDLTLLPGAALPDMPAASTAPRDATSMPATSPTEEPVPTIVRDSGVTYGEMPVERGETPEQSGEILHITTPTVVPPRRVAVRPRKKGGLMVGVAVVLGLGIGVALYAGIGETISSYFTNDNESIEGISPAYVSPLPPAPTPPQVMSGAAVDPSATFDGADAVDAREAENLTVDAPQVRAPSKVTREVVEHPLETEEMVTENVLPQQAAAVSHQRFTVQIRSTRDRSEAESIARKLRSRGARDVRVEEWNNNGVNMFRVRYGSYVSSNDARSAASRLGHSDIWIVKQ